MAMQFGRDERTGQLGYWDGTKFVPLGKTTITEATQGATGRRIDIDPNKPMSGEDQRLLEEFQKQTTGLPTVKAPLPGERAAELERTAELAGVASQDPRYIEEKRREAKESFPEMARFAAETVAPSLIAGPVGTAASAAIRGGGLLSRLARMAAMGAGGYGAEKAAQAVGLSKGDETTAGIAGGLAALPGIAKPVGKALSAEELSLRKLTGGEKVAKKATEVGETASKLYKFARSTPDISSEPFIAPLDNLMARLKTTPNVKPELLSSLENLRETLVDRITELTLRTTTKPSAGKALEEVAPVNTIEGLMQRARQAIGEGPIKTTKVVGAKKVEVPRPISTENLVDDLKQLNANIRNIAERSDIPGLTQELKKTYQEMAAKVPGLKEADIAYAQSKGLERGAEALLSSGARGVAKMLLDKEASAGLTEAQKRFVLKEAMRSDGHGVIIQNLFQNPIGKAMLRAGVTSKGIQTGMWSAALQVGARMAGLGQE